MAAPARIPSLIAVILTDWGREHGVRDDAMREALGVADLAVLGAEDSTLGPQDYERLLALLAAETGCESLGLEIGARQTVASYGVLGHTMLSAATAGEALRIGLDYYRITSAFMTLAAERQGEALVVSAVLDYPLPHLTPFALEEQMVGMTAVARDLLGQDFGPLAVDFTLPEPAYAARLRDFFRAPVRFGQAANRYLIDVRLLDVSLRTANALTARHLLALCDQLLARTQQAVARDDLLARVQAILQSRVGRWPGMPEVAEQLGLSERTLRRRLQELGTDFQTQIDQARRYLAMELIRRREITVENLAAVLGYSEAVSFRRAFQRWTGVSPSVWREREGGAGLH